MDGECTQTCVSGTAHSTYYGSKLSHHRSFMRKYGISNRPMARDFGRG